MSTTNGRKILVIGGAGFIGSNLVERLLQRADTQVCVYDNLSRQGAHDNLRWLYSLPGNKQLEFIENDVRDARAVWEAAQHADEIYHFAAQVAVTTSVAAPREDFEVNAIGTFNVLEAARQSGRRPFVLFTSTNKVYGSLEGVPVAASALRYHAADPAFAGVQETELLDFHSPYGCSKGAADQYVRDYARIYQIPTVVFRMSCIAGPRQFGTEDQGWVAHFLYSALEGRAITIYGDGRQVRDVLHVYDLVDAMLSVHACRERVAGGVYNLGGGPGRSTSILELLQLIEKQTGMTPQVRYSNVRPGDQPLYISDTGKLSLHTGWSARYSLERTVESLHNFWLDNRPMLESHRFSTEQVSLLHEEVA
ncbi:UDP-glucose 4-epimerase [Acidisarcina polymorpha]|uniref:UDP-glucose 4-epimerase n=1 Tax=Acidisarcina polymorpha TaxID=2211140 RepID=A0A2Z5G5U5_9BACT|nr:GDP-mannose 4,6-dehydratase [Acidisarcina polymorpha]AXC14613.1 UDP-glucose 4-epimerase [Acidisarcina polymorpha]